jgi:DNA-binding CsgD family transcriptional regulator
MNAAFDLDRLIGCATSARSFEAYEHAVLDLLRDGIRSDVAFWVRKDGLSCSHVGLRAPLVRARRARWAAYGVELAPVLAEARAGDGTAIDVEVMGRSLESTTVFREWIAPHGGRSTLIGVLALGEEPLATIALGRRSGSFRSSDRDRLTKVIPALSVCEAAMQRRSTFAASLSPREAEVVRCVRLGYTNAEVARALGTSVNTVRAQLRRIFEKTGATNRAELVALSFGHAG